MSHNDDLAGAIIQLATAIRDGLSEVAKAIEAHAEEINGLAQEVQKK
jgi:hypothetical protein